MKTCCWFVSISKKCLVLCVVLHNQDTKSFPVIQTNKWITSKWILSEVAMCKMWIKLGSKRVLFEFTQTNQVLGCDFGNKVHPNFTHCGPAFPNHFRTPPNHIQKFPFWKYFLYYASPNNLSSLSPHQIWVKFSHNTNPNPSTRLGCRI